MKEAAIKEAAIKEAAIKEAAMKEAAIKEAAIKEAAIKEAAMKEAAMKEAAMKEEAMKEEDRMRKGRGGEKMVDGTNYRLTLQYDGTRYHGWQRQGNAESTIQGKLEAVLSQLEGRPVEVHGSGRTDAGVHALAQVANARLLTDIGGEEGLKDYLNRYLPEDIAVLEVSKAPDRFHSRLSAVSKTYLYWIETAPKKPVFWRRYCYGLGEGLDVDAMRRAASLLVGTHDFKSFCGNRRMKKSTVRRLDSIRVEERGSRVALCFTGEGFLQNMARILAGTLIEVGLKKRGPESMPALLQSRDRSEAGFTAPPEGLFLCRVEYDSGKAGKHDMDGCNGGLWDDGIFGEDVCKGL